MLTICGSLKKGHRTRTCVFEVCVRFENSLQEFHVGPFIFLKILHPSFEGIRGAVLLPAARTRPGPLQGLRHVRWPGPSRGLVRRPRSRQRSTRTVTVQDEGVAHWYWPIIRIGPLV